MPSLTDLQAAADARNIAVHPPRTVPGPRECVAHALVFFRAWCALQRTFVTTQKAAELASDFRSLGFVYEVFLFGSLARGADHPRDIDLLILDDGELSFQFYDYGERTVESLLESANLSTPVNRAAERCAWIDVIAVDRESFTNDKGYRRALAKRQKDPLFFVNIADGMLSFDQRDGTWNSKRPPVFELLATLRRELEEIGVVEPPHRMLRTAR